MRSGANGGDDYIRVGDMSGNAIISGDADRIMEGAKGGDDFIRVDSMTDNAAIFGDASSKKGNPNKGLSASTGGDDTIVVGEISGKAIICGDAYYAEVERYGTTTGNDKIIVGKMSGEAHIYGDTYNSDSRVIHGDDTIIVGEMAGGIISGDNLGGSTKNGGDDIIKVGNVTGTSSKKIYGNYGDDSIEIANVSGDNLITNAGTGADNISVGSISGNTIEILGADGNDIIKIDEVYGSNITIDGGKDDDLIMIRELGGTDNEVLGGMGNDIIHINDLSGDGAKIIDGGGWSSNPGNDVFIYDKAEDLHLELKANGDVIINNDAGYANASIKNFEGIGGGAGNDTLVGNAKDNILLGGGGDNTLTGGKGSDIFVFMENDLADGPVHNIITDFNVSEKDIIDIRHLIDFDGGDIFDYLSLENDGNDKIIKIKSKGQGSEDIDMTITLENSASLSQEDLLKSLQYDRNETSSDDRLGVIDNIAGHTADFGDSARDIESDIANELKILSETM